MYIKGTPIRSIPSNSVTEQIETLRSTNRCEADWRRCWGGWTTSRREVGGRIRIVYVKCFAYEFIITNCDAFIHKSFYRWHRPSQTGSYLQVKCISAHSTNVAETNVAYILREPLHWAFESSNIHSLFISFRNEFAIFSSLPRRICLIENFPN